MKHLLLILLLLPSTALGAAVMSVEDDFDSGNYDTSYFHTNYCPQDYSCRVVPSPGGIPGYSLRMEYRPDDCTAVRSTQGAQLAGDYLAATNNHVVWTGFRLYFSENLYTTSTTENILFGYHGYPDAGEAYRSGPASLGYADGEIEISIRSCLDAIQVGGSDCYCDTRFPDTYDEGDCYLSGGQWWDYQQWRKTVAEPVINAWNDIVYETRYDWDSKDGYINIWVNGVLEYATSGHYIGMNDQHTGYPKVGNYYYSCGGSEEYYAQYFDEVNICEGDDCVFSDVVPTGGIIPSGEE